MSLAERLIAQADPEVVERVRQERTMGLREWLTAAVVVGGTAAAMPWLWGEVAQYGHATASVVGVAIGLAITWPGRDRVRRPYPSTRERGPRGAIANVLFLVVQALATWWIVQQEGRWAGVFVGALVVLWTLEWAGLFMPVLATLRVAVRRWITRDRDARARLAEHELDELAWTLANRYIQHGEAMREWVDRVHPELSPSIELVDRVPGKTRGLTGIEGWMPDTLAVGLRRRLPDGTSLIVQPVEGERTLHVVTRQGAEIEVDGLCRAERRRYDWKNHAGTVVAARIAAGPTVLVVATEGRRGARRAMLLVGGGPQPVPVGCQADQRVQLEDLVLAAATSGDRAEPRVELLAPASAAPFEPKALTAPQQGVLTAVKAVEPRAQATASELFGFPALRLTLQGGDREVFAVPMADPGWMRQGQRAPKPSVLVVCEQQGAVWLYDASTVGLGLAVDAIVDLLRVGGAVEPTLA